MAIARPLLAFTSILILAGGIVMSFFVILSGAHVGSPLNKMYFLQVSGLETVTGNTTEVRNPSRWTFFSICGVADNGDTTNCGATVPALPFDPPRNFGTETGLPRQFDHTHHFYYMSRFMFAFYLIALFFAVCAFFLSAFAMCTRLGSYLSGFSVSIACFFQVIAAALMTAWTVQGRRDFRRNNQPAKLGTEAYALTWTTFVCYFLCTVLFCVGGGVSKDTSYTKKSSGGYFGRKKSSRSRGSFRDSESARRVKDEYASSE